jgi:hypothetical protein
MRDFSKRSSAYHWLDRFSFRRHTWACRDDLDEVCPVSLVLNNGISRLTS